MSNYKAAQIRDIAELKEVIERVNNEFKALESAFASELRLPTLSEEPSRPRDGTVAYAEGVAWDPGGGEGIYAYFNGAWTKMDGAQPLDELLTEISNLSVDPNADSGLFFDDSTGLMSYWTPVAPLSFSGVTLVIATSTTSAVGAVELATTAEAAAGTDTARAVTAAGLQSHTQTWAHSPDVIVEDQKATNVDGGTATTGSWEIRALNTLVRNFGTIASLATNKFTLPAGTFYIRWSAPAGLCGNHQTRLWNATTVALVAYGTTEQVSSVVGGQVSSRSEGSIVVTIGGSTDFELHHRVEVTRATTGYGTAANFGNIEVYSRVEVWKVA